MKRLSPLSTAIPMHIGWFGKKYGDHSGSGASSAAAQPWRRMSATAGSIVGTHDELIRITSDHSLVNELYEQGALTASQAEQSPQRHVITRAVGAGPTVLPSIQPLPLEQGDLLLLCTDGLTSMVPDADIRPVPPKRTGGYRPDRQSSLCVWPTRLAAMTTSRVVLSISIVDTLLFQAREKP